MFDPFGLRREIEHHDPVKEASAGSPAAADAPPPSRRFWATLLIVDTLFLLVFGAALGSMMMKQWATPVVQSPIRANKRAEPKKSQAAETPSPPPAPASPAPVEEKKPEPPKKAETPEPAKAAPLAAARAPLGRPSVLAPDLPRRDTPGTAQPQQAAPKMAQPNGERQKAKIVIFSCPGNGAKEVFLKGPFLVRTRGEKKMLKDPDGIWRSSVSLLPGTYKYSCAADGKKSAPESIIVE